MNYWLLIVLVCFSFLSCNKEQKTDLVSQQLPDEVTITEYTYSYDMDGQLVVNQVALEKVREKAGVNYDLTRYKIFTRDDRDSLIKTETYVTYTTWDKMNITEEEFFSDSTYNLLSYGDSKDDIYFNQFDRKNSQGLVTEGYLLSRNPSSDSRQMEESRKYITYDEQGRTVKEVYDEITLEKKDVFEFKYTELADTLFTKVFKNGSFYYTKKNFGTDEYKVETFKSEPNVALFIDSVFYKDGKEIRQVKYRADSKFESLKSYNDKGEIDRKEEKWWYY